MLPLQKGGRTGKVLTILKRWGGGGGGGCTKCFGVVITRVLEVSAILEEGHKRFPPF